MSVLANLVLQSRSRLTYAAKRLESRNLVDLLEPHEFARLGEMSLRTSEAISGESASPAVGRPG